MAEREVAKLAGFKAGYVDVAGLPTWREVRGEGPALVLPHGGFSGAAAWSAQAPALAGAGFLVHCTCLSGAGTPILPTWTGR
jgi:hypothetical protein